MKLLSVFFILVSFSSQSRVLTTFEAGIDAVSNGGIAPQVTCEDLIASGRADLPQHCRDLMTSICSNRPPTTQLNAINDQIIRQTYDTIAATATQAQRNEVAIKAIGFGDERAYDTPPPSDPLQASTKGPSRNDVRALMDPARWNIVHMFNGVGYPSAERQRQLVTTIQNVRLKTGTEYVRSLIEWGRSQNPSAPADVIQREAITTYTSACGRTGLEVNAFYEEGEIVLCPGLAVSMRDVGANGNQAPLDRNQEIKAALIFTMSHEISHSIDYLKNPSDFERLKQCFEKNSPDASIFSDGNKIKELTSDYFGAYALGRYLSQNQGELEISVPAIPPSTAPTVLRILSRALGGFCASDPNDTDHANPNYRINQIVAKTPMIKSALGCPDPSADNPSCSMRGEITR